MRFHLEITTDNAAFEENGVHVEVTSILADAAQQVMEQGRLGVDGKGTLRDCNGNRVGEWRMIRDRHDY